MTSFIDTKDGKRGRAGRALAFGLALGAFALGGPTVAQAGIFGLTNTGVDLGPNAVDEAWTIISGPSVPALAYPSAVYADATNGAFPIDGYWTQNTAISQWDTPFNPLQSNTDPSVNGSYVYQTQFTVTGTPSSENALSFNFAADNEVASISLNGTTFYTGTTDGSSQYWNFIPVTAYNLIQGGTNTLLFNVINYAQNGGNPSGLDVRFTNVSAVPEPSTWAMMLAGFAGLGLAGYRSRRPAVAFV